MATYGSTAGVQALVPSVGTLGVASTPTAAQVTQWLAEGNAIINRHIASASYSVPVLSGAAAYAELTALENLYAAAQVKRALGLDLATGDGEDSSEQWLAQFFAQLRDLARSNLALLGLTVVLDTGTGRRRRLRSMQLRRVDGYSGTYEGSISPYSNVSD